MAAHPEPLWPQVLCSEREPGVGTLGIGDRAPRAGGLVPGHPGHRRGAKQKARGGWCSAYLGPGAGSPEEGVPGTAKKMGSPSPHVPCSVLLLLLLLLLLPALLSARSALDTVANWTNFRGPGLGSGAFPPWVPGHSWYKRDAGLQPGAGVSDIYFILDK